MSILGSADLRWPFDRLTSKRTKVVDMMQLYPATIYSDSKKVKCQFTTELSTICCPDYIIVLATLLATVHLLLFALLSDFYTDR